MLNHKDILILGMMIFALFLGAGNIIFPPMEGYYAGQNWLWAALGFVITGVLMPFITLVVVAILGRGEELSRDLPKGVEIVFWVILYLVLGPMFAMPRVTNVSYEMAWKPLQLGAGSEFEQILFVVVFCCIGLAFTLRHNTVISSIGKFMTPALLALLVAVSIAVIQMPLSEILPPNHSYAENSAITMGMIGGYQTMDVLAATAFGGILARALAIKKVTEKRHIVKYTLISGIISVILLTALYFSLFYLGATSDGVAKTATNGGQIFSAYVGQLFGHYGVWVMSAIVFLANLTTFVGLLSACADYFSKFHPRLTYPIWAIIFTILTALIAQVSLNTLLRITIPALLLIYPIAIMLVILQFVRNKLPSIKRSYYATLSVTLFFSLLDSLNNLGIIPQTMNELLAHLPLYADGLAWLIPTLVGLGITLIIKK